MNLNLHIKTFGIFTALIFSQFIASAATFTSTQSGNWFNKNTWAENAIPSEDDDVIISDGHTVTITGSAYTFYGNLTINTSGELVVDAGDHIDGFVFCGYEFHVFGTLTFTADKDLSIVGNSLFWGHPNAVIWVTDDWKISANSQIIVESICVRVDDDFHIDGTTTTLCGDGGVSIGATDHINTFILLNGATTAQVCTETKIYRSHGGNACSILLNAGSGNINPVAVNDEITIAENTATAIDVLDMDIADSDGDAGDVLTIVSAGLGFSNDGQTQQGGTVSINKNGTLLDPTDDYIDYVPAFGFLGLDVFRYVITDKKGGYATALVNVTVNSVLPVELVRFSGEGKACTAILTWSTASELNNSHFEVERSVDGYHFKAIGNITGSGTTTAFHVYDFTDHLPNADNYYRLVQVDYDGTRTTSDIIYIQSDCVKNEKNVGILTLFPNPAIEGTVSMRFKADIQEEALLMIHDLHGKSMLQRAVAIEAGMNDFSVDITDLQAGTYVMTLGQQTTRFIVARD